MIYLEIWKLLKKLFADDTTIVQSSNNTGTLYKSMNEELEISNDWFKANKLSLNASKTNYILFINKNMELNFQKFEITDQWRMKYFGLEKLNS